MVESSRLGTPAQPAAVAKKADVEDAEVVAAAPYWYEHVSDEQMESWQSGGRQAVQDAAKDADEIMVTVIIQELVRSALDKRLDASEAGAVIKQMAVDHEESEAIDVHSILLNTISLLDDADTKNSNLLTLLAATEIDPEMLRYELDIPLLQTLALVRSTFTQMRTRKTTNILYRQANFNLLREESEGYAKLITEYFNTANEAVVNHDVSAEAAFQRIKALVGSFDLDVGRVLDITLDISANLLVRAYGFFVKFYRCSSWWPEVPVMQVKWEDQGFGSFPRWALPESQRPMLDSQDEEDRRRAEKEELAQVREARDIKFWQRVQEKGMDAFFDLGSRRITNIDEVRPYLETEVQPDYDIRQKEINADRRKRVNENRKFMRETRTLPPSGNSDAAQLLGFKLRFYASDARNPQDTLPENLIYLAALLIKIGFISLRDLYPHLHPADENMADERSRLEKEKAEKEAKERPGGGMNALVMAGALPDDTLAPGIRKLQGDKGASGGSTPRFDKKDDDAKEALPTPSNQKLMLLKALLLIGALPEALYILGRFPWLLEVDITLAPYLHRIVRQMLSKVADATKPLGDRPDTQQAKQDLESTLVRPDGSLLFRPKESKKVTRWLGLDVVEKGDGQMYRHYYPDWEENIPICQNVEDVVALCNSFIGLLGVKIGQDAALLSSLVRIAKHSLTDDASESNRARWLEIMKRLLVPALSLSKHNVGMTQEVYELLKFFPTTTRYNIYAEWYIGRTSRQPDMRVAFDHNKAEVKDILRRITNETGKKQARALAKVSLSSPGIVIMMMISQIEEYSNMIASLVECTRYFSLLGYDVLTWALINSLSGQGKSRIQADGMLTSRWLQYISQFVASLFLRYTFVTPSPILQYLAHQLSERDSTDLEMFEQVLTEMAGIRSDIEFNDAQVILMAGGEQMQARVMVHLADKRYERKPSAQRLIKALTGPNLIGQTLVSIAQERQMYAYRENTKLMPLKVLGNNLDKIQTVFTQYLEVLKTNLKPEDFETSVPSVVELVGQYGLEPGTAFTICRTAIAAKIATHNEAEAEELRVKIKANLEKKRTSSDTEMQDGAKPLTNGNHTGNPAIEDAKPEIDVEESKADVTSQPSGPSNGTVGSSWHPVLEPIIQGLLAVSSRLAELISIPFFVSFWTFALQDVLLIEKLYEAEINKIEDELKKLRADRSNTSALAVKERQLKIKETERVQNKLRGEKLRRMVAWKTYEGRSAIDKLHWFSHSTNKADIDARHIGLLQVCFLPRAMLSSLDAHYSFTMLKMLHDLGTPGFSTMHLLNHLMKKNELAAIVYQCTAMEAQHFGRFLCESLKWLQLWHANKDVYDRDALGLKHKLPGFAKKFDADGRPEQYLDFEDFRRLLYNWHCHLSGALQACFESGEYMHIRNGITVLRAVVPVFPALNFHGHNMVKHVTAISQEDTRQDLKLAAMSLLGPLKNREKSWVMPQAFRLNNDAVKEVGRSGSRAPSARPGTPQPGAGTPKLSATAPEFKPTSAVPAGLANGDVRKESVAETEDGEIEDAVETSKDVAMKDAPADKKEQPRAELVKAPEPPKKEPERVESKSATPAALPSKPPPPPVHVSRPGSAQPGVRPGLELPARLDSRAPTRPLPAIPSDRPSSRYSEDRGYGRLERPNDVRPGSRGHSPSGRRRSRSPVRDAYYNTPGSGRGSARDERPGSRSTARDMRHPREEARPSLSREPLPRPAPSSRQSYDSRDRPNGAMGPPTSHAAHPDRASHLSSAAPSTPSAPAPRVASTQPQETQAPSPYNENPARMALINDDPGRGRERPKDSRPNGHAPEDRPISDARPNGGRTLLPDPTTDSQARTSSSATDLAPNGPRRDRSSRDLGAGGLQESSYGRLNGPEAQAQAPAGPRPPPNGPSGRGGRSFGAPQGQASSRPHEQPVSSPSAAPPTEAPAAPRGPAGRQHDRRGSQNQFEQHPTSHSVPTTPIAENGPAVHPSRLAQLGAQPPPIQTNVPSISTRSAASPTTAPPSGPRASTRGHPVARQEPSPTVVGPPSGPASDADRQRRGDRQRANINATLQGGTNGAPSPAPGQSVNFRGAAQNRTPSMSSAVNAQPIQAIASPMEPPQRRAEPVQAPRTDRPPGRTDVRQDSSRRGSERYDERAPRHVEDPNTEKHRSSRTSSRERRAQEEQHQHPRAPAAMDSRGTRGNDLPEQRPRDERNPRGGSYGEPRAPRTEEPRRPAADMPGSLAGSAPPPDWNRGNEPREPRRDGRPEDGRRPANGGGRLEDYRDPRREEDRRQQAPSYQGLPPPGARKRGHEDGPGYGEAKRRRSGR